METLGPLIDVYLRDGLEIRSDLGLEFVAAQLGLDVDSFKNFLSGGLDLSDEVLGKLQKKFGDGNTENLIGSYLTLEAA